MKFLNIFFILTLSFVINSNKIYSYTRPEDPCIKKECVNPICYFGVLSPDRAECGMNPAIKYTCPSGFKVGLPIFVGACVKEITGAVPKDSDVVKGICPVGTRPSNFIDFKNNSTDFSDQCVIDSYCPVGYLLDKSYGPGRGKCVKI